MEIKRTSTRPDYIKKIKINIVPTLVYNIYECQECIIEVKQDNLIHKTTINKNRKCEHGTPFLLKYKKCTCGTEWYGSLLRITKRCQVCQSYESTARVKLKKYYRLKIFCFKSKTNLNDPNKWDCHNRSYCLEVTFKNGSNKGLACLDCPFYIGNSK